MDEPRRNDLIDRELRRAFAAGGGAASGAHLDAEIAAAWVERRLDAAERRAAEAHLADCHDCQALLATLARISPEEAPAHAGGLGWWRQLRAGWLVPATVAAAAALVIWVAVPQQRAGSTPAGRPQTRDDRAAVATPAPVAPEPSTTAPAAPAAVRQEADAARRLAKPGVELERKAANLEQAPAAAAASLEARERLADAAPTTAPPAATPPPPGALSETITVNPPQSSADKQRAGSVTVTGESPAPAPPPARQEVAAGASARALDALASRAALARVNPLVVVAADNTARWRRAGAGLEFAPRGDVPFTTATLPVAADAITAGSSPGGTVCWLAGRGGGVLVATDGLRFTRVTAPVSADLIAITATDARTATVTAADGRRFRTTDQGANWTALP